MFKAATLLLGIGCWAVMGPVSADSRLLTFEGVGDDAQVLNFYNGGTDSQGHSGPNYGIAFSPSAGASISFFTGGGKGNFTNAPSGVTVVGITSNGFSMDVAQGFADQLSFFYSSYTNAATTVYTGLDGTGDILTTISLAANHNVGCDAGPSNAACNWDPIALTFDGVAKSVVFNGTNSETGFDNIAISPVPEPGVIAMLGCGLGVLLSVAKRRFV